MRENLNCRRRTTLLLGSHAGHNRRYRPIDPMTGIQHHSLRQKCQRRAPHPDRSTQKRKERRNRGAVLERTEAGEEPRSGHQQAVRRLDALLA